VQDFYIGVASEPEKSWQVYITCAHNKVPSMADLKKIFGVDISYFVDFIQESIDEDSKRSKESLPCPSYLRGPISGDQLCVQEGNNNGLLAFHKWLFYAKLQKGERITILYTYAYMVKIIIYGIQYIFTNMNIVKLGSFINVCLGQCREIILTQRMKFASRITSPNFSWKPIKYFRCCMPKCPINKRVY
jgi:hypothetical protein